jgi:hypothetical protein
MTSTITGRNRAP